MNVRASFSALRIKQLLLLVALDQHKSIRKAADEIHVSQPAASKSLVELESAMGRRLFERHRNGLRPTSAGHCVVAYARDMLGTLGRMRIDLDRMNEEQQVLRIGTIMGAVPRSLSRCLRHLRQTTRLQVVAEEGTSAGLLMELSAGRLDLIFARSQDADDATNIMSRVLGSEEVCVVASPVHPLARGGHRTCEELQQFPWVAYEPSAPLSRLLHEWFEQQIDRAPDVLLRTTSALITVSTVLETDCLALLPDSVFQVMSSQGGLKKISTSCMLTLGRYSAYWHRHSQRLHLINLALDQMGPGAADTATNDEALLPP